MMIDMGNMRADLPDQYQSVVECVDVQAFSLPVDEVL